MSLTSTIPIILLISIFPKCYPATLATSYTVYHEGKKYPRPLLITTSNSEDIHNHDVLAFSGTRSDSSGSENAFVTRYNTKGEKISEDIELDFHYEVNACIRQVTDDTFIVVSGAGDLVLIMFNEHGIIKKSVFENKEVVSFKIDIYVISSNLFLIGYCSGKENCGDDKMCKKIRVQKYKFDNTGFSAVGTLWEISSDNRYISCVQMGNDYQNKIICQYVEVDCNEHVNIFSNDLVSKQDWIMEKTSDCPFDKIIKLDDKTVATTYQSSNTMKYSIVKVISDDYIEYDNGNRIYYRFKDYQKSTIGNCKTDTNKVDTTKWDSTTIVFVCTKNTNDISDRYIFVGIVSIDDNGNHKSMKSFTSINAYADTPFISKFGSNFMSIFYHYEGGSTKDNVFEIVGFPACANIKVQDIFINSKTSAFSLKDYVTEGSGEFAFTGSTSHGNINIYFPENYATGYMTLEDGTNIVAGKFGQIYDSTIYKFRYVSGFDYGIVNIKFQPERNGQYGRYCWITFEVKDCYLGCYTCQESSNDPDYQKCSSCANQKQYYQLGNMKNDETMNCLNEGASEGFYLDENKIYRRCNETCRKCLNSGNINNATCYSCKDSYLYLEIEKGKNYPSNCYKYETDIKSCPDGYFYTYDKDENDEIRNERCGKCYETCSKCSKYGTRLVQNCEKCKSNYYFKSNETTGNCYTGEIEGFFNKEDTTNINGGIYIPCDLSCIYCNGEKIEKTETTSETTNCKINNCKFNENYFPVINNPTNCLQPKKNTQDSSPIEGYYLNKNNDPSDKSKFYWDKCYETCSYCSQSGGSREHYCLEFNCIKGTYPSFDKRTNCWKEDIKNEGYYLGKTKSNIEDPDENFPNEDIYLKCFDSCQTCNKKGDYNLNNCQSCKSGFYPKWNVDGSCVQNPEKYYIDDINNPTQYLSCYQTCKTCKSGGTDENNLCTECLNSIDVINKDETNSKIFGYDVYNCHKNCESGKYYPKDSTETECRPCITPFEYIEDEKYCINCHNYGKYHIKEEESCINSNLVDDEPSEYPDYFKLNDTYGTIQKCNDKCKTCFNSPGNIISDDGIEILSYNCLSCDTGKKLQNGNCVNECGSNFVEINNICINCKKEKDTQRREMYKLDTDNTKCYTLDEIPENAKIINSNFNVVTEPTCVSPCKTCLDSDQSKCLSCINDYYEKYVPDNLEYITCERSCDKYLFKDTLNKKCINCKERNDNLKYYFDIIGDGYNGICVDKNNNNDFSDYFESEDEEKKPFGVLEKCHDNCNTCLKSSEIIDGKISMNCETCKTQFYHDLYPSTNCNLDCKEYLGKDETNENDKKCINCKETISPRGNYRMYKYIGDNILLKNQYCIEPKPEGTYIEDEIYNTLKDCDISCKTCENSSTNCIECSEGYIKNPSDNTCVPLCNTIYWYYDENNNYKCINECNDIQSINLPFIGGYQCVDECIDDKCDYCKTNAAYILYNEKYCKFKCPLGFIPDSTGKKCIEYIPIDDKCKIKIYPARHSTLISNLKLFAIEWIEEYIFQYNTSLTKHVDVLPAHNMTMQIWKDDECEKEASLKYHISFVNTSKCREILEQKYVLPKNGILFVKFDLNRTSMMNQIHYNAYNAFTREKLNISLCEEEIIEYSFSENGANYELAKKINEEYGVDIFNSSDDFFNDNCFHFDDNNKDVTLNERRLYYFQNVYLCEKGCEYMGTNYTSETLSCYCEKSLPSIEEAEELTEPEVNEKIFYNKIDNSNFMLFKCSNLVFNKNILKNKGSLCILCLTAIQIPIFISFAFFSGFKPIYSFLNQFTYLSNPNKRKNNNFVNNEEDNDSNENEEDNDSNENEEDNDSNENEENNDSNEENNTNLNRENSNRTKKFDNLNIKSSTDRSNKFLNNNLEKETNFDTKYSKNKIRTKSEKLTMSNPIHLQNYNSTNSEKFQTTTKIFKNNEEEKDNEIIGFNEDEKDELNLNDALKFDDRNFLSFIWRIMKKKITILYIFTDISVFEPLTIKFMYLILMIGNLFFFNALLFKKLYIQLRFFHDGNLGLKYFLKKEIQVSIYSSLIVFIIGILLNLLISVKKQFVICVRNIKSKNEFLINVKKIMKCYKIKIVIFLLIDLIGMFIFFYFCSAFASMYIKTINAWFYSFIFSIIFLIILQFVYSIIISSLRYIGLSCRNYCIYKLSQILL